MVAAAALVPQRRRDGRQEARLPSSRGGRRIVGAVGLALAPASVPAIAIACYGVLGVGLGADQHADLRAAGRHGRVRRVEERHSRRGRQLLRPLLHAQGRPGRSAGAAAAYTIGLGGYVSGAATQTDAAVDLDQGRRRRRAGRSSSRPLLRVMLTYPLTEQAFRTIVARDGRNGARRAAAPRSPAATGA